MSLHPNVVVRTARTCAVLVVVGAAGCAVSVEPGALNAGDGGPRADATPPMAPDAAPVVPDANPSCPGSPTGTPGHAGFEPRVPAPTTARVVAVDARGLDLATESGSTVRFDWVGPALPFTAGETVTLDQIPGGWDTVRGPRATARAYDAQLVATHGARTLDLNSAVPPALRGPDVTLPLSFEYVGQCTYGNSRGTVWDYSVTYALRAAYGERRFEARHGETVRVGPASLTNGHSYLAPGLRFATVVTLLEPR